MPLTDYLTDIADAIRTKTYSSSELTIDSMPAAIRSIPSSSSAGSTIAPAASDYTITKKLSAIGNAIREKTGGAAGLTLAEMPEAIRGISTVKSIGFDVGMTSDYTGLKITGIGTCTDTDLVIPQSIYVDGIVPPSRPVKLIDAEAFYQNEDITSLTVPYNIDSEFAIWGGAFMKCSNLTSVHLGGTLALQTNGNGSYDGSFEDCYNLTEVNFGNKLQYICARAFYNCKGLKEITLPASLNNPDSEFYQPIAGSAFGSCTNLTDIYVPWGPDEYRVNVGSPWGATNATIHYNHTA